MKSKIDFEKLVALFETYRQTEKVFIEARNALTIALGDPRGELASAAREHAQRADRIQSHVADHRAYSVKLKGPKKRKFKGNVTETVRQFVNASAAPVNASDVARAIGQGINSIQVAQAFQSLKARGIIIPTETRGYYFRRPVSPADVTNNAIAAH